MKLLISFKEIKNPRAGTAGIKLKENFLLSAFSHKIKVDRAHRGRSWNFFPPEMRLLHTQMLLKIPAAGMMVAAAEGEIANTFSLPMCSMPSCVNAPSLKGKKSQTFRCAAHSQVVNKKNLKKH